MIWKTLGFQAAAVAAIVAVIAFIVPLPSGQETPPNPVTTALHNPISPPIKQYKPTSVDNDSADSPEDASPDSDTASSQQPQNSAGPLWSPGPEHDARESAEHHWQKHGSEFSELHSEQDYTSAAHDLVNHPPPGAKIKRDSRGDRLIYDPDSNTFAVQAPDGAPRTMFRPHNGRGVLGSAALSAPERCACPVCGHRTLSECGVYEICSVCGWEDDPAQSRDPDLAGGANRESLNRARANWRMQKKS